MTDPSFWHGKRVFVTGHTGFKGSWLCLWLQSMGVELTGYALSPDGEPNLFELANVSNGMTSVIADVNDVLLVTQAMNECNPDIVLHLAAQSLVRESYNTPVETFATNVMGTINVLEAARAQKNLKSLVIVTTDKCYDNKERSEGYKETEALGGKDPYSASKACAELATASYRDSFLREIGIHTATARAGNVIGGGDWAKDRLVPDILAALDTNAPLTLRNPDAVRPWQHVLEPLAGYLLLAEKLYKDGDAFASAWNFGPSDEDVQPVSTIATTLADRYGRDLSIELEKTAQPHEAKLLSLDSTKARTHLGWQPRWRLDGALAATADWQKAWNEGRDMHNFTVEQIKSYINANTESQNYAA